SLFHFRLPSLAKGQTGFWLSEKVGTAAFRPERSLFSRNPFRTRNFIVVFGLDTGVVTARMRSGPPLFCLLRRFEITQRMNMTPLLH
ncbi:MAG TPA: hypothetical protein VE860_20940, partial [Chthoniobacterales bacterium]|nr:hypothetical protein [Chthoniobacterales bacterium]